MRAYRIAYDGQPFHGFQRQPDVETVEGTLFSALESLDVIDTGETPPGYAAAGRTDAGVSAVAQTIAFDAPEWLHPEAFNSELPESVRVWAEASVPADFHATHDARSREYTYFLYAASLDRELAREALAELSGEHDFHNLTPDDERTDRELSTTVEYKDEFIQITLSAVGFSRQLVRRVMGLVSGIGRGEIPMERIDRVLGSEPLSGPDGIGPAPPQPLVLTDVVYPGVSFEVSRDAAVQARELFEDLRVRRLTGARVAGSIVSGIGDE